MSGNQVREAIFEPKCKMHNIRRPLIHVTLVLLMLCAGISGQTKDKEKEKAKQGQLIADSWWAYVGSEDVNAIVGAIRDSDPELADNINKWLNTLRQSGEQTPK